MTGKLIIIEGCDGTGKTTLIEGLKKTIWPDYIFNYKYPEEKSPKENMAFAKGEYLASIRIFKELLAQDKTIICDRFHLGEYAYGVVKRGYKDDDSLVWLSDIEEAIKKELSLENVKLIVLLVVDPINAYKRLKPSGEYLTTIQELDLVNRRYQDALSRTCLPCHYAFTDMAFEGYPEKLLHVIVDFIGGKGVEHL